MPEISVIVPVYKVEQYLARCVDSILEQTYSDFELILVDDGSPDSCGEICDRYAEVDDRVHVVHKQNGGLSSARNAGLDVMQGKYVAFIDSDDVVHPQYLEILLALLKNNKADLAMCHYDFFKDETQICDDEVSIDAVDCEILQGRVLLENFIHHCRKVSLRSQCMKLYKKEIFEGLRMRQGYTQEDAMALPHVLERAHKIARSKMKLYHWRLNPVSISRSGFQASSFDYIEVSYYWAEFFSERKSRQADYFKCAVLEGTLKYYYRIVDEKRAELMKDYAFHLKRYRKLLPKYIWAKTMCMRERWAYLVFLICPKAARGAYMKVYGEKYRTETW